MNTNKILLATISLACAMWSFQPKAATLVKTEAIATHVENTMSLINRQLASEYTAPKTTLDIIKNIKVFLDSNVMLDERVLTAKNIGDFFLINDIENVNFATFLDHKYSTYQQGNFEEDGLKYFKEGKMFLRRATYRNLTQTEDTLIEVSMAYIPWHNMRMTRGFIYLGEKEKARNIPKLDQIEKILGYNGEKITYWTMSSPYQPLKGSVSEYEKKSNQVILITFANAIKYEWREGNCNKIIYLGLSESGTVRGVGFEISNQIKKD